MRHKLFLALSGFLLAAPIFLAAGAAMAPERAALFLLPAALSALLALADSLLPGRLRVPGLLLAALLCLGGGGLMGYALGLGWYSVIPALLTAAALLALARLLAIPRYEVPPLLWFLGLALYFAVRLVGSLTDLYALPRLLYPLALAYVLLMLLALTLQSLWDGMGGGRAPSRLMKLRNGIVAVLLGVVLLILTHLPALGNALRKAVYAVIYAFLWLENLIGSLFGEDTPQGGGEGDGGLGGLMGEVTEPSAFQQLLEKILRAFAIAVAVIGALLLLWQLFKLLRKAMRKLIAWARSYAATVSGAYEDTVESLIDGKEARSLFSRRKRNREPREKPVPWEQMTPRQRVRSSYRAYLRRHADVPESRTARQQLPDPQMAALYEAARYSSQEITPEQAESSRQMQQE